MSSFLLGKANAAFDHLTMYSTVTDGGSPGAKDYTGTKLQGFLTHHVTRAPVLMVTCGFENFIVFVLQITIGFCSSSS